MKRIGGDAVTGLIDFWWQRLPAAGGRISRTLATLLGEGVYLTTLPVVAGLAPVAAIAIGLLAGWHRLGVADVLTQSGAILALAVVLGLIAAQLGLLYTVAYALADLLVWRLPDLPRRNQDVIEYVAGLIITYVALGVLATVVPLAVRTVRAQTPLPVEEAADTRVTVDMLLGGATAALLTWLFVSAMPMLVRPVFFWQHRVPNLSSVEPVQEGAWIYALIAFVVAAIRVLLEYAAAVIDPSELEQRALAMEGQPPGLWERVPASIRVIAGAVIGTVILAGLVMTWEEAALLFGGLLVILGIRSLGPRLLPAWPRAVDRLPVILRLVVALPVIYVAGTLILTGRLRGGSFVPLVVALFGALLLYAALFPAGDGERPARTADGGSA